MPRKPPAPELPSLLQGGLVGIEPDGIVGWARDGNHPDLPVQVRLMVGGQVVGEALANQFDDARVRTLVGPGIAGFVARLRVAPSGRFPMSLSLHGPSGQALGTPLPVLFAADLAPVIGLEPANSFEGHIDGVHAGALMGWARDTADQNRVLELELFDTGVLLSRATANRLREDLRDAGLHHGLYGFSFDLPVSLLDGKPHSLSVQVAGTRFILNGGPIGFGPQATSVMMTQMAGLQAEVTALRLAVDGLTAPDGALQRRILRTLAERMAAQAEIQREQLERELAALRAMVFAAADAAAHPGTHPGANPGAGAGAGAGADRNAAPRRQRRAETAMRAPPPLIMFAPLPPMPTGIGDYTHELLPLLATRYRCTVVAEDVIPDLRVPAGVRLIRLSDYEAAPEAFAGHTHLYMLGNNPDHVYMLPVLARWPGVVVLHDPGLHHLLDCATASLGDADGYCAAVEADFGAPGRVLAEQWRADALRDGQMLYRMPMLRHLLGPARHVIVHSRHAALTALTQAPDTPVTIAPHLYAGDSAADGGAAMRARLGIGASEIVFLSLGFVSHIKRVDSALRALARIAGRLPPFRYVIAGEVRADELDVERMVGTLGLARHVVLTGYVAEADFFAMIDMADVVINLRHPVGGETSGTLIRAMGRGACVVVVDAGPFAELPDGVALRLPWGPAFETALSDTLFRLAMFPAARAQIGAAAAAHVAARHSPAAALAAYAAAIDAAALAADRPWRTHRQFAFLPPQNRPGTGPLWARAGAMPCGSDGTPALPAIAGTADRAALTALGHAVVPLPATWRPRHEPARGQALLFANLGRDHPLLRLPRLLDELNRMLAFGGTLLLCLSDAEPHGLASRWSGEAALGNAGFRVDLAIAALPPSLLSQDAPGPPCMVWRAVKVSEFAATGAAA